jgi:hypothetical protein
MQPTDKKCMARTYVGFVVGLILARQELYWNCTPKVNNLIICSMCNTEGQGMLFVYDCIKHAKPDHLLTD